MFDGKKMEINATGDRESSASKNVLLEGMVREFFADGVKVLGLPKSVGEIYGSLFISKEPLSLDDLVERLGISKGSGSQGLKMLRTLGAVSEVEGIEGRKVFYEADVELKSLVGGFIREEIRPHLSSAKVKIGLMDEANLSQDTHYDERIKKLNTWRKRAGLLLPVLQKILGK
jgi:DNA-binding transcriptional regulator GbsR (MarR family)